MAQSLTMARIGCFKYAGRSQFHSDLAMPGISGEAVAALAVKRQPGIKAAIAGPAP